MMPTLGEVQDDIQWPALLPIPEPGQGIHDDDCVFVTLETITLGEVEIFLRSPPDWLDQVTRFAMQAMLDHGKANGRPSDKFISYFE